MIRHRFPDDARCLGRDRRRGLALVSFHDRTADRWIRRWFADQPSTRAVTWYDDAMDRDSTETTMR